MKLVLAIATLAACSSDPKTDAGYRADVVDGMHASIGVELQAITDAAIELQAAAPTHAWDAGGDASAIAAMKVAWKKSRVAYEHVEGATAPIFPDLDFTMDARYDDFLAAHTRATGMHAIERVLYAPDIRAEVIAFEHSLPGYEAAAWPKTDGEAMAFKTELVQKLIDDSRALHDQWTPAAIDIGAAYVGLIGLMNEQKEKVNLAATGEEESRYANVTLFDLRNNLAGTTMAYELFRAWVDSKPDGGAPDDKIQARFTALEALYNADAGDGIPVVPEDWSSDAPTAANLATPFGMLWSQIHAAVDPAAPGSVVFEMNSIAKLLGFDQFIEGA